jgi:hypothetical protein
MTTLNPPIVAGRRRRSSSIKAALSYLQQPPPTHHLLHLETSDADRPTPLPLPPPPKPTGKEIYGPKWLQSISSPGDSFVLLASVVSLWAAWECFAPPPSSLFLSYTVPSNPFAAFLFISYPIQHLGETRYKKGWNDVAFLAFYVVAFSFVRQAATQFVIKGLGTRLGVRRGRKMERFLEQVGSLSWDGLGSGVEADAVVDVGVCSAVLWMVECVRSRT